MSLIDRVRTDGDALLVGGVLFDGLRGVSRVQVRTDEDRWIDCDLETPLSPYTWTRCKSKIPAMRASLIHARALDGRLTAKARSFRTG